MIISHALSQFSSHGRLFINIRSGWAKNLKKLVSNALEIDSA